MKRPDARVFTVSKLEELPSSGTFYVIAMEDSYVTDHGWPGNNQTCTYVKLEVYLVEQEWIDAIKSYTQLKRVINFRAFVMTPPVVKTDTTVEVPFKTK